MVQRREGIFDYMTLGYEHSPVFNKKTKFDVQVSRGFDMKMSIQVQLLYDLSQGGAVG